MKYARRYFILTLLLCIHFAAAQGERHSIKDRIFSDTLVVSKNFNKAIEKSTKLYDTIYRHKSWFSRTFMPLLITSPSDPRGEELDDPSPKLEVGQHYFNKFSGKTITAINVTQSNVFTRDSNVKISWAERFVDGLHRMSDENVIRKNLLFKVGDKINPYELAINEELLRSLSYLATAYFLIELSKDDPTQVIVNVYVRDSWTISGDLAVGGSKSYVALFDRNFLGTGNELYTKVYLPHGIEKTGVEAQYKVNNLFGTFTNVNFILGAGETNNTARIEASRPFIMPTDHIWGLYTGYTQQNAGLMTPDTTINIKKEEHGLWYGYSWNLDRNLGTTFYAIATGKYLKYSKRPEMLQDINPYYYNSTTALLSIGLSRQNYFQGNMIYGYGRTEDISYGYKFELTSGIEWNEFLGQRLYVGGSAAWGGMLGSSYFGFDASLGGFFNEQKQWEQSVLHLNGTFFSPLFRAGKLYLRQFVSAHATWGFNRTYGQGEQLSYGSIARMYGLGVPRDNMGHNRLTLNTETVFFTPIFLYHFRFAFFAWGDVGLLGYERDMFKNPLSAVAGIGVRIKNERLIFNNIQLRLGVVIRRPDDYSFNPFSITNEEVLRLTKFTPDLPKVIPYE